MGRYVCQRPERCIMNLILASASPRRREILACLGVPFTVFAVDADESCDLTHEGARVETIAAKKCAAAVEALTQASPDGLSADTMVLASDTLVSVGGEFLGKPTDEADVRRMLNLLSGRTHHVSSGLAVYYRGKTVTAHEMTEVTFAPMSEADITAYIATGESFGKAGAYAIQGHAARYIEGIHGDYFNVVGLPVHRLCRLLKDEFGVSL